MSPLLLSWLLPPRDAGDCLANLLEADWQVAVGCEKEKESFLGHLSQRQAFKTQKKRNRKSNAAKRAHNK
jgi:hypothetical protein